MESNKAATTAYSELRRQSCCFTGHRPEKISECSSVVCAWLEKQIDNAIAGGYTRFISGMAKGVDLWAGIIVLQKKKENPNIQPVAATPYPEFSIGWDEGWRKIYQHVWQCADE